MNKGRLRRGGFDDLGLRRALADRMLPLLVAAMAFLAALALAGATGAAALARHWRDNAAAALTIQVPRPGEPDASGQTRLDRVAAILHATPGLADLRVLSDSEMADLLRPWLGAETDRMTLPLPAVIAARAAGAGPDLAALTARLDAAAPGAEAESHGTWVARLSALAVSLQACAWAIVAVVAGVAACVVAVATRAGLVARREAIEIVHGLGAADGYIAGRFARRTTLLAAGGGVAGALLGLPVVLALARVVAPFSAIVPGEVVGWDDLAALPTQLWMGLPALPVAAAAIGFVTTQLTVRRWLRRLA